MEPVFPPSVTTNWINTIGVVIGFLHHTALFIHVYYKNKKEGKELSNVNPLQQSLYTGAITTYLSFVLYNISTLMLQIKPLYEAMTCTIAFFIALVTYIFSRYCVWMFSLLRIRVVFHSEVIHSLGYKNKTLTIISIIFTITFIIYLFNGFAVTRGVEIFIDEKDSFCLYEIKPLWTSFINATLDQWCTIGCFLLFYKKMRGINKLTTDSDNTKMISYVLKKYSILMAANLLSTWLLILIIMISPLGVIAGTFDSIINMWTIVMFDARYDKTYQNVFCCILSSENENKLDKYVNSSSNLPSENENKLNKYVNSSSNVSELATKSDASVDVVSNEKNKHKVASSSNINPAIVAHIH